MFILCVIENIIIWVGGCPFGDILAHLHGVDPDGVPLFVVDVNIPNEEKPPAFEFAPPEMPETEVLHRPVLLTDDSMKTSIPAIWVLSFIAVTTD